MAQLRQDYLEFVNRRSEVIVVGPDDSDSFNAYWHENDLPFIGLPDPKAMVLRRYGQEVNLFKLGRMPAQVIVDKKGIVRYAHFGHSMSDIPDNCELMTLIDELNWEGITNDKKIIMDEKISSTSNAGMVWDKGKS
jgi:peroxiredoxin